MAGTRRCGVEMAGMCRVGICAAVICGIEHFERKHVRRKQVCSNVSDKRAPHPTKFALLSHLNIQWLNATLLY
jgi:hypothetical protein